jgi:hypothetical protein
VIPASSISIGLARQTVFDNGGVVAPCWPVTVTVKAIPDEPGFSGAGRFKASARSTGRPSLGEAATLRFRVEGTGSLKWIDRGRS